jgi:hypothetical protein
VDLEGLATTSDAALLVVETAEGLGSSVVAQEAVDPFEPFEHCNAAGVGEGACESRRSARSTDDLDAAGVRMSWKAIPSHKTSLPRSRPPWVQTFHRR